MALVTVAIIPLDDDEFEQGETVIVSVSPATSSTYTVGTPASATVTIFDNEKGLGGGCGRPTTSMRASMRDVRGSLEILGALLPLLLLVGVAVVRRWGVDWLRDQGCSAAHVRSY